MVKNHETKIRLTKEEFTSFTELYKKLFPEIKKSVFYRLILLRGYQDILSKLLKQSPEELKIFLMRQSKK